MMRLPWIEDCENCGFVSIFLLYPCKRSFTCTETPKNKGTDFSKGKVRHDNHQLLQPITNQNNKNNCDKLMTRRMESLNISRRELLKEFFALTPEQKKKWWWKKLAFLTWWCLSTKQRDHWSWNLQLKWNFTLYSYQLKRQSCAEE